MNEQMKEMIEKRIVNELEPVNVEELYRELLDEGGQIEVAGLTFLPSRIVEELDPVAFRCGVNDYVDSLIQDETLTDEIEGNHYNFRNAEDIALEVEESMELEKISK